MKKGDREDIVQNAEKKYLLQRSLNGCRAMIVQPIKLLLIPAYLVVAAILYLNRSFLLRLDTIRELFPPIDGLLAPFYSIIFCGGFITLMVCLGSPKGWRQTKDELKRAGFTNHAGEAPLLLSCQKQRGALGAVIWKFEACGIPLAEWEKKRPELEAALNINIVKIEQGRSKREILLHSVSGGNHLPDFLPWRNTSLDKADFVLVLGESLLGPVTVDLAKVPHILLGGSTGSGKSVLLKLLLMQAVQKGARVTIADFKGGVDFSPYWQEQCKMCFETEDLLSSLTGLAAELEARKKLLRESGSPNLREYNRQRADKLPRLVFACDEVAEVLDKTGRSREEKELLAQIENRLSVIARQGRAFGIHLILATQRPDATVIPGQIRSNMDFRVCGRADSILSQIILDNSSASEQIPKTAQGRFITGDGTLFQAYWVDDGRWLE